MSKAALDEFRDARVSQTTRNDARRIRTRVEAALNNPTRASRRWPFELMQNAHDAGPRCGDDRVEIDFLVRGEEMVVSHTGMPFTPKELAALLSGGSSKEFDDEETTGRFGTGFLVTHGVSPHVDVEGVLTTQEGNEHFRIKLVRDGDEDSIVENIAQADKSLRNAVIKSDSWIADNPTASFTYRGVNCDVVDKGLVRLQQALPYLYATCRRLGMVRIITLDKTIAFNPRVTTESEIYGFIIRQTEVIIRCEDEKKHFLAIHFGPKDGQSALLAVTTVLKGQHSVNIPDSEFSRLFVKFPIAGTHFLPFNVVLDGKFTPEQERDGISMNSDDRERISTALSVLPSLARHAVESNWLDANKLARLAVPSRTISGEADEGESTWWRSAILEAARATATEPIVETSTGRLPALHKDGGQIASFLVPSIYAGSEDQFSYELIHELAAVILELNVPVLDVAKDWGQIARNWADAGVPIDRLGVEELTDRAKAKADCIHNLPIVGDPFQWLTRLLLLVAELAEKHKYDVEHLVTGLLPDQHGQLRNPRDLRVDGGIPEELKDIAHDARIDLRSQLLHNDLWRLLHKHGNESARDFISNLLGEHFSTTEAKGQILAQFDARLSGDSPFEEGSSLPLLRSSARMIVYLGNEGDTQSLLRCPLLTSANTLVRLVAGQQILAPVKCWSQSHQPYANLYTEVRILSHHYYDDATLNQALGPLVSARLAISTPLYKAVRPEIADVNLLNSMSIDGQDVANMTVRNESFGQIAFLSTDLVQRCGRDPNLAKLLLKFVLKVAVREDLSWQQVKQVNGTAGGEQVPISLRSATWPFELKVRSWVPVQLSEESEHEGYAPTPANETNLRELYDPSWLRDSPKALDLLNEVFGFRQLTLMIDGLDTEEESNLVELLGDHGLLGSAVRNRELLRSADENPEVANLISEVGAEEIQEIREVLEERRAQSKLRESNRSFGHAAQHALADAIRSQGLKLNLVDQGFDYEVFPGSLDVGLEEASFSFKVGSYLLEVKATTSGDVRLTPLQAKTASESGNRFVLCVIDLRGKAVHDTWEPSDVEPYAKIVSGIGDKVVKVYQEVDSFTNAGIPVRLHNDQQLRYGVAESLWGSGLNINAWVQSLKGT